MIGPTVRRDPPQPTVFFRSCIVSRNLLVAAATLCVLVFLPQASGQISTVVFSDDFAASTIDTNKYQADAPFFEGGLGDIHAVAGNGVMQFVGTTTQRWWSGATLRIVPTFTASEGANVAASIDRVAEAGLGSASRSALWILDETRTKYVLFADVRGEGNWHYNRNIGEAGDSPTGGGPNIAAFDGAGFDDGGLHRMKIVADGSTVKLYLDDQLGQEVKFPFSTVVFEFGSYARDNNDTADTTWDNLKIETVRKSTVVFSDDFASNTIDPAKYQPDAPFFEGGLGTIHAVAGNGVMQFVGTTTQRWWSGATLRVVPTFAASDEALVALSVDRVAEAGLGSASRSALWILDETRTKYVLFADVRGEGNWHYNRNIGEAGDSPTGGGPNIAVFDGATFDDGGLHRMSMVVDGKTVKLSLDGQFGQEVKFPFSPVIFEFGSYARDNNDTADTTWDNLKIETAGAATFAPTALSVRVGQASSDVTLRIPPGFNASSAVQLQVSSSDTNIAIPEGGVSGALTVTFPAGGANTATFKVRGVNLGGALFNIQGGLAAGNQLSVAVISGPGVLLQEDFAAATIDSTKWQTSNRGFEATGAGTFTVAQTAGALEINGTVDTDFWPGASLKTAKSYVATKEVNLAIEVDRVLLEPVGSGARSGVFITTGDRSKYVFFSQNSEGNTNWQVNVNPATSTGINPTGGGFVPPAFSTVTDLASHRVRLVADGETVEVFLDGKSGGRFPFAVTSGIFFELGVYGRSAVNPDTVRGLFDNVKIENVLPSITLAPIEGVSMTLADAGKPATVTVPTFLHDAAAATVTITSSNQSVAVPAGAVNGSLTLNFPAGGPDTQTFNITPVGLGSATFGVASTPTAAVSAPLKVEVVAFPQVLLTDDFSGAAFDPAKWKLDTTPFETGTATAESAIILTNGQAKIDVTAETATWPGLALLTVQTFSAAQTTPVTFEIDRVLFDFVLVNGTSAKQRTGLWIKDAAGNFVFFNDYLAHDGGVFGWNFNRMIGQTDDNPIGIGTDILPFAQTRFDDRSRHRAKIVANGSTVRLYLDEVFGAEVPFPFAQGLTFGFGAYVGAAADIVRGYFDDARITGGSAPVGGRLSAGPQGANLVISWTGTGVLQFTTTLAPAIWQDVTPAPTGNSATVTPTPGANRFYRLR
jgi:hypothetical protein